jgi:hypothetical protein
MAGTEEARATPTFPAVVQRHYGLATVAVDPPQGCQLCHVDDIGGTPMTLRPFGRLLSVQFGVAAYDDASLEAALTALDSQDPQLGAEIKNGGNPNTGSAPGGPTADGGAAPLAGATPIANADPVPGYGCTIGSPKSGRAAAFWPIGVLTATLTLRRRRRG